MSSPTGSAVLPPDRQGSPGSLIVSFAGSFLRQLGGAIAVADLICCLGSVGIGDTTTRQALSRLKARGFLAPARPDGRAGYALTEAGLADLTSGDRRIFARPATTESDGWVLAVFSVPESERAQRHRLRSELSWLGFGTVAAGVWVAPRHLAEPTRAVLAAAGLDRYVTWFAAQQLSEIDVARWWDLPTLRGQYERFLAEHERDLDERDPTDEQAFARYLRVIDSWRVFPRIDPGLPASLLPPDWPAGRAWSTFNTLHDRWAEPALAHVRAVTRATPPAR
jgi:phenylacetic acid degradation operon negative regulatory protein